MTTKVMIVCLEKGPIEVSAQSINEQNGIMSATTTHQLRQGEHVEMYVYEDQEIHIEEVEI